MTSIVDVEVSASPHRTLNTIRGVLSEEDFLDASEEEILEGLKDAGVVAVKRIMFRKDGKETPSKHVILTFARHTLPETVKAGYLQCRIRPYVPNPQRCFRCQRFGHGSRSCEGKKLVRNVEARNMLLTSARQRPAVAKENIPYLEAKKKLSFLSKGGYAEVVRRGPAPRSETRATQVSPEILAADLRAPSHQQEQHAAPLGKDGPAIAVPALPSRLWRRRLLHLVRPRPPLGHLSLLSKMLRTMTRLRSWASKGMHLVWMDEQGKLLEELHDQPLDLAGDGRCDSPGYCAKYLMYSLHVPGLNKILHFEQVQVGESEAVRSSGLMEKEGLIRCLAFAKEKELTVQSLTTDRHRSIAKHMREKEPAVRHYFDVWHVSKNYVAKRVTQAVAVCKEIGPLKEVFELEAKTPRLSSMTESFDRPLKEDFVAARISRFGKKPPNAVD
ncbi:uncharacterized protein ISCGN_002424 [Ixodes scapularis]